MPAIQSFDLSDRGRKRRNNQDFAARFEPSDPGELQLSGCLYVVADGVGGAEGGERASRFAAQKLLYEYYQRTDAEPGERLRSILEQVNRDIFAYADENHMRMATTLVAAVIRGNLLYVANVGDSRAYLLREGRARQLTQDHSVVGEMVASGEMTEAEAQVSTIRNRLARSLGGEPEVHVDVHEPMPLNGGDQIVLCSDGLTRYALPEDISRLASEGGPEAIAGKLISFANERGGADNVSVVVASYAAAGVAQKVVRIPRPRHVDWETLQTSPFAAVPRGRRSRKPLIDFSSKSQVAAFATGLVVVIAVLSLGVYWAVGRLLAPAPPISPFQLTTSTPTVTPTLTLTPTVTVSPTEAATVTPTLIATTTGTPMIAGRQVICPLGVKVRPGPSQNAEPVTVTLLPGDSVDLTMVLATEEITGGKLIWLQIYYPKGTISTAWVVYQAPDGTSCIDIPQRDVDSFAQFSNQ